MRILVVTSSFPRHRNDIAGHFVFEQVVRLARLGHSIDLYTWDDASVDSTRAVLPTTVRVHRVRYTFDRAHQTLFYGAGAPENLAAKPLRTLLAVPAIAAMFTALLRAPKPDLYVAHWFVPAGVIVALLAKLRRTPYWIVGHSGGLQLLDKLPNQLKKLLFSILFISPGATRPTASITTKPLHDLIPDCYKSQCLVMPMGYALPATLRGTDRRAAVQMSVRAIFIGRLVPIKGVEVAIESALAAGIPIDVVGDGPLMGELRSRYRGSSVVFHGAKFGEEKWELVRGATVSLHPSVKQGGRHEGLPVSVLECASAGVIPLVSGMPGMEEYLVEGWQVCEEGDVVGFAKSLELIVNLGTATRFEIGCRQKEVVAALEWDRYIARWDALFRERALQEGS